MPALTDYLSRRGEILVLVLVLVLSIALMVLSSRDKVRAARALNDAAMTPVQSAVATVRDLRGVRAENDSLRALLARSAVVMAELAERGRAAERLEEMLAFRERSRFDLVAARVVGREAGRGRELKIDKGLQDGVRRNLAVMSVHGLVGKVSTVEPRSAYVRPVVGPNCRVSARVTRTRTEGILDWSPGEGLHLSFLPFRAEVEPGDAVVSAGLGGVFPRGIAVGVVTAVETDRTDGSVSARVRPVVEFDSLEEVFVVTGQHAEADASADQAVAEAGAGGA